MGPETRRRTRAGFARVTRLLGGGLALLLLSALIAPDGVGATPFSPGDVVVGLASSPDGSSRGELRHFSPAGAFIQSLLTTSGSFEETGACFDAAYNLLSTNFEANSLSQFDPTAALVAPGFTTGLDEHPNSCVLDAAGSIYVGLSDQGGNFGGGGLVRLNPAGGPPAASFSPAPDQRGTDWIDLAADQCTIFYTSQGASIKRFDVCANAQLPDFCIACDDGAGGALVGPLMGLRLLPDGGLLVAEYGAPFDPRGGFVHRFDAAATHTATYVATNSFDGSFYPWAVALDTDLAFFWAIDNISGEVFRFDLAGGSVLTQFQAGVCDDFLAPCAITGIAIVGEPTAATQVGDVAVTKSTSTPSINAGDPASYTVTVSASGTSPSANVVLSDPLPAGLSWTVGGADASFCSPASPVSGGTTLTCSFGTMASGSTRTITLSATSSAAVCGTISNSASVSATGDANPANNAAGPVLVSVACPDVSVTKSTSTPSIAAGSAAVYSIVVSGNGPGTAQNVALSDPLPSGLTWAVSGADASFCSPASPVAGGTTLTCNFGTLAQGASRSITLSATTSAVNCGTISNSASVSATGDANPANNASGPILVAVTCPDVSVTKSTSTPSISAGDPAVYSVVVTGNGPGTAENVVLSDPLPAGLTWTVSGADAIFCSPASPVAGGTTLTCNFGALAQGGTRSITLSATTSAASCGGSISNSASVIATGDGTAANNASGPVLVAVSCPDVAVTKSTSTPSINAGDVATYTIAVSSNGPGTAQSVVLTDPLPAGLSWTVSGADAGFCSPASPVAGGTTLTCSFGAMAPGAVRTITLSAVTSTANCGTITNSASVAAAGDTASGNNTAGPVAIAISCNNTPADCPEDPNAILTLAVDHTGAAHGSVPVYTTVQAAYDAAHTGDVIGLFSTTTENVTLGGSKSLTLTQCTVAKVTASDPTQPAWNVTSTGALTIIGPDAVGGSVGWRIASGSHSIKSVRSTGATQYGILVTGANNSVSVNAVSGSPVGIRVAGNGNDLRPGGAVSGNSGNGVEVAAGATGNTVRIGNIQGNGGNGVQIDGNSNTVTSNGRVDSNGLNGILVNGTGNTISNNAAGSDNNKGNGQAGIKVAGGNNTLDNNKVNDNTGVGVDVTGAANKLKSNQSNQTSSGGNKENGSCEYRFADNTTVDQGSNKKDNANFKGGLSGPKFAAGCYE